METVVSFLKDEDYRKLLFASLIMISIGATFYHFIEGWSWIDCMYFCVITLTTIGYGDFSPQTDGGKIFTMVCILIGLGMILSFINTIYNHYESIKAKRAEEAKDKNTGRF